MPISSKIPQDAVNNEALTITEIPDFTQHYTGASLTMSYCNPREANCFTYSDGLNPNGIYHAKIKILWGAKTGAIIHTTSVQFGAGKTLDSDMRDMFQGIPTSSLAKHQSFICFTVSSETAKGYRTFTVHNLHCSCTLDSYVKTLFKTDGMVHKISETVPPANLPTVVVTGGDSNNANGNNNANPAEAPQTPPPTPVRNYKKTLKTSENVKVIWYFVRPQEGATFFNRDRMMPNELYQRISQEYRSILVCSGFDSGERVGSHCRKQEGCVLEGGLKFGGTDHHRKRCGSPKTDQNQRLRNWLFDLPENYPRQQPKIVCLGDLNRVIGHVYRKAGGAFCLENDKLWKFFLTDFEVVYAPYSDYIAYEKVPENEKAYQAEFAKLANSLGYEVKSGTAVRYENVVVDVDTHSFNSDLESTLNLEPTMDSDLATDD
ncbi:hypothetical protein L596_021273 [Steinernema carpocapsae]|uniref:Uncharacterized protein n=1 Tax=Steinernema carpocapsae TaxID=34508 RepID=A0A4U5MJ27_STECR|nr:hypothetical protein L596_021273 [Steinernema carpocapsae]